MIKLMPKLMKLLDLLFKDSNPDRRIIIPQPRVPRPLKYTGGVERPTYTTPTPPKKD